MQGSRIAGRYEILDLIGEGGMARVYRARDLHLGREVAVKVLLDSVAREPDLVERFRREARSSAALGHPNIVQVYDFLDNQDGAFLIMELVRGEDLRTRLRRTGPMPVAEATRIATGILAALEHAHAQGLIHRDISARNVLLDEGGGIRVSDFGIARALGDRTLTRTGELVGSVQYISPEQARGDEPRVESDLYGVGILLYEMVTGTLPFVAESPVQMALKHINDDPEPPSRRRPGLPHEFEDAIMRAMAKDPEHRFHSAREMAQALGRASTMAATEVTRIRPSAGHPVVPPPAAALPPAEPPRRPGMLWVLVGTAVVALLVGILWAVVSPDGRVDVPDLVGLPLEEARRQAEALGLDLRIGDQKPSPSAKPNTVLEQSPAAGATLRKGGILYVTVSQGPETVAVPDLQGLTESRARDELMRLGLEMRRSEETSTSVSVGVVISQDPAAGTQITKGTPVQVVVSTGSGREAVPSLVGMKQEEAEKVLADLGMSLVLGGTRGDASAAEDTVLEQNPSAGTMVPKGQKIRVILSRGREGLAAPDLVGKSVAEAQEIAKGLGIELAVEGGAGPDASIVSQSPAAGEPMEGTVITVSGSQTATVPNVGGMTVEQAAAELEAAGLRVGEVSRAPAEGASPGEILDQDPKPGVEAERGAAVNVIVADASAPTPVPTDPPVTPVDPSPAASWVP